MRQLTGYLTPMEIDARLCELERRMAELAALVKDLIDSDRIRDNGS
jgi:hypothetical protein